MAKPLTETEALHWENSAKSHRLEAKRARNYESKQTHERDAIDCEAFAKRIRDKIAAYGLQQV